MSGQMIAQFAQMMLYQTKLPGCHVPLHCALGLSQGAPVVAELCPASLRRIRHYAQTSSATTSADTDTQTNTQTAFAPHRQSWSRVPVCPFTFVYLSLDELHDLIFALESPFAAEGRSCLFFFRYNDNLFTDSCLCLTARDQQHTTQIQHPNSADIANT